MIPKVIHYCWFGGNPLPKLAKKCIKSWKKYCPDYKIIEWNESNLDIENSPLYIRQAHEAKKYGFVPDYFRAKIIFEYGGIYLDTDVQIIKSLDSLLLNKAFFGFENLNNINLGHGFGGEKGLPVFKEIMDQYLDIKFINNDGTYNMLPSPQINTKVFLNHGLKLNNQEQLLDEYIKIYPIDYFCPKSFRTGELHKTKNTYSIHHFDASWFSKDGKKWLKKDRKKIKNRKIIKAIIGERLFENLKKFFKHN